MRAFQLLTALIGLVAAAPAPASSSETAIGHPAARDVSEDGPWTSYMCSQNYMNEYCVRVYAYNKCGNIPQPVHLKNKSMMQWKGWLCVYYWTDNCDVADHAALTVDSRKDFVWMMTMGSNEWGLASANCIIPRTPAEARGFVAEARGAVVEAGAGLARTVLVCSEPGFRGNCTAVDAWRKCSGNFNHGAVQSVVQQQGAVCQYFRELDCAAGHSPSKQTNSTAGTLAWADMADWTGKVRSFHCDAAGLQTRALSPSAFPNPQPLRANSSLQAHAADVPGHITVCTRPNLQGQCWTFNAWMTCLARFPAGLIRSVLQDRGAVCQYYTAAGCYSRAGEPPYATVGSAAGRTRWEMGAWEGRVVSVLCTA